MPFKKGYDPNRNAAGRPQGAKTPNDLREIITTFVENNISTMQIEFDNLDGKDKLKFLTEILPYAVPKLRTTEILQPKEPRITIHVNNPETRDEIEKLLSDD